jgi:hypothetical protein
MHVPRKGDGAPCVVLNGRETRASVSEQGAHVFVEVESGAHTVEWCA